MKVRFKLDCNSVIKLYSENLVKTKGFNKVIIFLGMYIICFVALIFILTNESDFRGVAIGFGLFTLIFIKLLGKIVYKVFFTKRFNKEEYNYLFKEMVVSIESENITIVNSTEERSINFKSINSLNIFEEYFFIVLSNNKHLLIPLSAFNNLEEKNTFVNMLKEKTGKIVINSYPNKLKYI